MIVSAVFGLLGLLMCACVSFVVWFVAFLVSGWVALLVVAGLSCCFDCLLDLLFAFDGCCWLVLCYLSADGCFRFRFGLYVGFSILVFVVVVISWFVV